MQAYYFGMAVEGRDPAAAKVLTLQYQALDGDRPQGNLTVMTEWEWGEKELLRMALARDFLRPGGETALLGFDLEDKLAFLVARAEHHGLLVKGGRGGELLANPPPRIDLGEIMARTGERPEYDYLREWDSDVASLYRGRNFRAIVDHLHRERDISLDLYRRLESEGPGPGE